MDLGNYKLGDTNYQYSSVDPQGSNLSGLMITDYGQLKTDLQTPGDLQINKAFDTADNKNRDIMGGQGLYGSSIYGDTINNSAFDRGNALASNASNAGQAVETLRSENNRWLGSAALDESRLKNTWNMGQNTLDKTLIHDLLLADYGRGTNLELAKYYADNNLNLANINNDAAESAASSNAWGTLGGYALGGLMNNFGDITSTIGGWLP